ncbi:hypothetical protein IWQ62_000810 [Dispira parvispora]|uniref:Endopeptidase S2P n=1 Tax=Dispira parvispora TaxID=1520584 RepID=A0A9W8AU07_9FUNG|nr:hypothetical protein IWQ62_000810 [Dispira parvispora]
MTSNPLQVAPLLIPVLPGVTLPWSHLGYLLGAVLVCALFHEYGHALAAFRNAVSIQGSGIFLYILWPGAFVDVSQRSLKRRNRWQRLEIICAGVWHNVILALLISTLLFSGVLHWCWSTSGLYSQLPMSQVAVVDVQSASSLSTRLLPGDIITGIQDYELEEGVRSWHQTLSTLSQTAPKQGFCVSQEEASYFPLECCNINASHPFGQSDNTSLGCFAPYAQTQQAGEFCLPIRKAFEQSRCDHSEDCQLTSEVDRHSSEASPPTYRCVTPYQSPDTTVRLIRIQIYRKVLVPVSARGPSGSHPTASQRVIFWGTPTELLSTVRVGALVPNHSWVPVGLAYTLDTFLWYILAFTTAFAIFNSLPLYSLDGYQALETILEKPCPANSPQMESDNPDTVAIMPSPLTVYPWRLVPRVITYWIVALFIASCVLQLVQ